VTLREKITGLVAVRLSRLLPYKGRVGRTKILSYRRLHPRSLLLSFQKACLGLPIRIYWRERIARTARQQKRPKTPILPENDAAFDLQLLYSGGRARDLCRPIQNLLDRFDVANTLIGTMPLSRFRAYAEHTVYFQLRENIYHSISPLLRKQRRRP
jgi:hypothetical protein